MTDKAKDIVEVVARAIFPAWFTEEFIAMKPLAIDKAKAAIAAYESELKAENNQLKAEIMDLAENLLSWKQQEGFHFVSIESDTIDAIFARMKAIASGVIINELQAMREREFRAICDYNEVVKELEAYDSKAALKNESEG